MTERQWRQVLANSARRGPEGLFAAPRVARILTTGARAVQRTDDLAEAWARVADPEWLPLTRVVAVTGSDVTIAVADGTLRYQLAQAAGAWRRKLAALVDGVGRVRFVPAGD
jgi:hypothetical protein